jgi:hypothetical protein
VNSALCEQRKHLVVIFLVRRCKLWRSFAVVRQKMGAARGLKHVDSRNNIDIT